jgi:hypothetical protein
MKKLTILSLLVLCFYSCTQEEDPVTSIFRKAPKQVQQSQGRWYQLYDLSQDSTISTYKNVIKSNQRQQCCECSQLLVASFNVSPVDDTSNLIEVTTSSEIASHNLILLTSTDTNTWTEIMRWQCSENGTERMYLHKFK